MNVKELSMKVVHPQAAGIDIGSKSHWVAVDQVADHVKELGVYTQDHQKMIDYLRSYNIDTIAMESTGISGSFLLSDYLQAMRTYYAHREDLIEQTSKYINKIQKALRLMNIRLDVVISDITGQSGRAILDAIVAGHRDPEYLASLTSQRLKNSKVRSKNK
jgi:transposase